MVEDPKKFLEDLRKSVAGFAEANGEVLKAFGQLDEAALKPGALDRKTKLLMCVAIAAATGCEYCLAGRSASAVEAGATRQELIEAASVGLLMGGSLAGGSIVTFFMDMLNSLLPAEG